MPEWDDDKAQENLRKHGVDFYDAAAVLDHPYSVRVDSEHSDEDRSAVVGFDGLGRVLFVVYTWRGDDVRSISARRATSRERRFFEAQRR